MSTVKRKIQYENGIVRANSMMERKRNLMIANRWKWFCICTVRDCESELERFILRTCKHSHTLAHIHERIPKLSHTLFVTRWKSFGEQLAWNETLNRTQLKRETVYICACVCVSNISTENIQLMCAWKCRWWHWEEPLLNVCESRALLWLLHYHCWK